MKLRTFSVFAAGFASGMCVLALLLWQSGARRSISAQSPSAEARAARSDADRTAPTSANEAGRQRVIPEPQVPLQRSPEGITPGDDTEALLARHLLFPVANVQPKDILDTFNERRPGGRKHEATDIMVPRGTPVVAVDDGSVVKLFNSREGGLTVYQFDPTQTYCYYYAHLDRYAEALREGMTVRKGDRIGYAGSTGDASASLPHLHFAIFKLGPEKHWWQGTPVNPYPILIASRAAGRPR